MNNLPRVVTQPHPAWPGIELATSWSQVWRPTIAPPSHLTFERQAFSADCSYTIIAWRFLESLVRIWTGTKIEIALESGSKSARVIWVNCYLSAWNYCNTPEIVYRPTSSCFSNAFKYKCILTCKNKRSWQNCVAQLIPAPPVKDSNDQYHCNNSFLIKQSLNI